ncbi:MAG: TIGR04086 family membrane protein [Clostridia bacterium]|nr:TIGR04086 family membrane protein [Clostridia bacterium]
MMKIDEARKESALGIKRCLKNILLAFLFAVVLLALLAVVFCYSPIDEKYVSISVRAVNYISIALAGMLCSMRSRRFGYLYGAAAGALYMLMLYSAGFLIYDGIDINIHTLLGVLYGLISGGAGGIVGINLRREK